MSKYRPRNDMVLIRVRFLAIDPATGVALPERSPAAAQFVVEEVGPLVTDLDKGDVVEMLASKVEEFSRLPRDSDLFITPQANVALVYLKESH